MTATWIRLLFAFAGLYDAVIGLGFLLLGPQLAYTVGVTPPYHWGFVQFPALLLVIFGAMFFTVAAAPAANRNLIPFGMALKASYTALVAYYWAFTDLPFILKPFAVIDAVMLVLFALAYRELGGRSAPAPRPSERVPG